MEGFESHALAYKTTFPSKSEGGRIGCGGLGGVKWIVDHNVYAVFRNGICYLVLCRK